MQGLEQHVYISVVSKVLWPIFSFYWGRKWISPSSFHCYQNAGTRNTVQRATWKQCVPLEQCLPNHLLALGYISVQAPQIIQNESERYKDYAEVTYRTHCRRQFHVPGVWMIIGRSEKPTEIKNLYWLLKAQLWALPQALRSQSNSRQGGRLKSTTCTCCCSLFFSLLQTPELDWPLVSYGFISLTFTPQQLKH